MMVGKKGMESGTAAGGTRSGVKKGGMGAQVDNGAQRPKVTAGAKGGGKSRHMGKSKSSY